LSTAAFYVNLSPEEGEKLGRGEGGEFAVAARHQEYALAYLREHKLEAVGRGVCKIGVAFAGVMSPLDGRLKNWSYFASYWTLMVLVLCGARPLWGSSYLQIVAIPCACHALSAFIFWSHTSHRAFLDPVLAAMAGVGLELLINLVSGRKGLRNRSA
jgi:hypothetical protein